jgi:hypothetical protein
LRSNRIPRRAGEDAGMKDPNVSCNVSSSTSPLAYKPELRD